MQVVSTIVQKRMKPRPHVVDVLLPLIFLFLPAIGGCSELGGLDKYGTVVLQYASSDMSKPVAAVGVLDGLDEIEAKSKNKEKIYLILLDYYIGESGGSVLDELISKSGKKIIPRLRAKKELPIQCEKQFKSICEKDKNRRNERIDNLITAIENGEVLCVDINTCNPLPNDTGTKWDDMRKEMNK